MKALYIRIKSFANHDGIHGHQGGSLPRDTSVGNILSAESPQDTAKRLGSNVPTEHLALVKHVDLVDRIESEGRDKDGQAIGDDKDVRILLTPKATSYIFAHEVGHVYLRGQNRQQVAKLVYDIQKTRLFRDVAKELGSKGKSSDPDYVAKEVFAFCYAEKYEGDSSKVLPIISDFIAGLHND